MVFATRAQGKGSGAGVPGPDAWPAPTRQLCRGQALSGPGNGKGLRLTQSLQLGQRARRQRARHPGARPRRFLLSVAFAVACGLGLVGALATAVPAQAAQLNFTGTLEIEVGRFTIFSTGGAGVATVNQSSGGHPITHLALPGGAFATTQSIWISSHPHVDWLEINFGHNPISLSGGGCTAPHPLVVCPGTGINGFGGITGSVRIGFGSLGNVTIPLPSIIGSGSTVMAHKSSLIDVTVSGAGWTTGTVSALRPGSSSSSTLDGWPKTVTAMGSRSTSPGSNFATDRITLVSPIQIGVHIGHVDFFIPTFARISLHVVPEPGTLVLLGLGVGGLGLYGYRRSRR